MADVDTLDALQRAGTQADYPANAAPGDGSRDPGCPAGLPPRGAAETRVLAVFG